MSSPSRKELEDEIANLHGQLRASINVGVSLASRARLAESQLKTLATPAIYIQGKLVDRDAIGRKVIYRNSEEGLITSWNAHYVFVRFRGPNGEACDPRDLSWLETES